VESALSMDNDKWVFGGKYGSFQSDIKTIERAGTSELEVN
jgi:hypothetical protein